MNDGAAHDRGKLALQRALGALDAQTVASASIAGTVEHATECDLQTAEGLSAWIFEAPVRAVGTLIGFAPSQMPTIAEWVSDFVACLSPLSTAAQLTAASNAADQLLDRFRGLVRAAPPVAGSLLALVLEQASAVGWDQSNQILANLVGLLSQTYEATAGLIGNSIVALMSQRGIQPSLRAHPESLHALVDEVSRYDPSVQNTKRFAASTTTIAGTEVPAGDAILLVLAAGNRDADLNPRPNEFLLHREQRQFFTFGRGSHACPGHVLASTIAASALRVLLQRSQLSWAGNCSWTYRPSVNARIPVFHHHKLELPNDSRHL